jgi:hypothetical protein
MVNMEEMEQAVEGRNLLEFLVMNSLLSLQVIVMILTKGVLVRIYPG